MSDPHMPPKDDNNDPQKQLEAQLQGQAELQGQLQGQGQGQGEHQSQTQSSDNSNINGNMNYDSNANDNANCNVNANYNQSDTNVTVDVSVADQTALCSQPSAIDMSNLSIEMPDNQGIANLMPSNVYQTISGDGDGANNVVFNLDQVNNLVSNGCASDITNGQSASISGLTGGDTVGIGNHGDSWDGDVGSSNGQGDAFSQTLTSAGAVDALTQSIVLGSNTQLNNLTFTGHDSVVADHGSSASHDASS